MADTSISVLIPARGRPRELARTIRSLRDTAGDDAAVEILVGVDDDEDDEAFHQAAFLEPPIRVLTGPRPATLGAKLNNLAAAATGEILWFITDDYVMDTPGWPARFRTAVAALPNGVGVAYPRDTLHDDHASFPLVPRRMMVAIGSLAPIWFPYWFVGTWWDELGILLGERHRIDVSVSAPEGRGRSDGIFDVAFWALLFEDTRSIRVRDAAMLADLQGGTAPADLRRNLLGRYARCAARMEGLREPDRIAYWEKNQAQGPRPERYDAVKAEGVRLFRALRGLSPL